MKRIICLVLAAVLCGAVLAGCAVRIGNGREPLPENPAVFTQGQYIPEGEDTGYTTLENGGKVFIPYGNIRPAGPMRDLSYAYGDCLGYVSGDENDRVYALSDDPNGAWLIRFYEGGMMEVPMVFRELNDAGAVPESVEPFEDEVDE